MNQYQAVKAKRGAVSVDLKAYIETCELNYQRLVAMLPGLRDGRQLWQFDAGDTACIHIDISLLDTAPYTSMVEVRQGREGMTLPVLQLRLYHDATVAEVICFDGHRNWQPSYDYPNSLMYQRDEKQSLNRFLRDWLVFCRKHGLVSVDKCESVPINKKA